MRLKVLQALECGGPGGTGYQVAALCRALSRERFDVGLVYSVRDGKPEAYQDRAGADKAFYVPELVREISPFKDLKAFFTLYRLFRSEAPNIVHAHSSKAGFLARIAAWWAGVPRIFYSPRGYGFLQQDRSRLTRAFYRFLEWSVSWIGEIVAVSPSEAELAEKISWGRPVRIVCDAYLGAGRQDLKPHRGILVGGCGRMTYARNMDAFVILAQRLTDSRNGLKCVWIGGGEEEPRVRKNLQDMNLLGKMELTGWLEPAQARERMAELDVFVHYSRWEGLPNAVLEAMALGLPVVASDVAGNRDAVEHGKTGFLAKSEIELLEYCLKLVDNPALRAELGAAAKKRVFDEFSLEKTLADLESIYLGRDLSG